MKNVAILGARGFVGKSLIKYLDGRYNVLPITRADFNLLDSDAVKVVNLAAGEDSWQNFMLFRSGKDENHVTWRLLQRFEERVESRHGKHVDLVYDKNAVLAVCGRDKHLVAERADIFHAIV